ncbi:DUF4364 family protein [Peptoniphilus sp. GNH]|nr:DUF4364 family protein [Peptoniphilus sp. GNH]
MFENDTQLAKSKLLILYLINLGEGIFDRLRLTDFLLRGEYLNYFLIFQYLDELLKAKLIDKTGNEFFFLTQEGSQTLELFTTKLDEDLLTKIKEDFKSYDFEKSIGITSQSKVKLNNDRADLKLILIKDGKCIFSLEFSCPSEKAIQLSKDWEKNYSLLYDKFMDILN